MISATIPIGTVEELPRKDLRALFLYLKREQGAAPSRREENERVEGILAKLAASSRMQ